MACSLAELLENPFCSSLNALSFVSLVMLVAAATIFVFCQYLDLIRNGSSRSACPACNGDEAQKTTSSRRKPAYYGRGNFATMKPSPSRASHLRTSSKLSELRSAALQDLSISSDDLNLSTLEVDGTKEERGNGESKKSKVLEAVDRTLKTTVIAERIGFEALYLQDVNQSRIAKRRQYDLTWKSW